MKPREYCCCAIPVMNAGIYATLAEQFVLALLVAVLALATPDIVGAAVPGFAKVILAIICFVGCGVQIFGFLGVFKEKPIMFRRYTTLHIMVTTAAFSVALAWIIVSATRHNTAASDCQDEFFSDSDSSSSTSTVDEGETLCNIFTWADIGLMGGLWVVLGIMQFYLYTVISSYGTGQRRDHENYKSIYSVTGFESGIPLANRADPWDARPSLDDEAARVPLNRGHARNESDTSVSTILAEKQQQEARPIHNEAPGASNYPQRQNTFASRQGSVDERGNAYPAAYTHDPQPTPHGYADSYYKQGGYGNDVDLPGRTQAHPGEVSVHNSEGMFGRKTSRLQRTRDIDGYY